MALPFPNAPLETGLIVGHTTDATARVWVRLPGGGPHELVAAPRDGQGPAVRAAFAPDPSRDYTAVVDLAGLRADTEYALDVRARAGTSVLDPALRAGLRTFPRADGWERLCFGVMSCNLPFEQDGGGDVTVAATAAMFREFRAVLEQQAARFVVALGDQVYVDGVPSLDIWERAAGRGHDEIVELYREVYRGYWGFAELARIHARFPNYMVWDDHDIRDNWGSFPRPDGDAGVLHDAMWRAARRTYDEYQHAHNPPTAPGTYHYAFDFGPVAFFVLDLRGQRDCARRQLLGPAQWRDFEAWLRETADRPARFVVSSVPVEHVPDLWVGPVTRFGAKLERWLQPPAPVYDRWSADAFGADLERFMGLVLAQPAPVTVLAGDIHIATAGEFVAPPGAAPVRQWVSSAVTNSVALSSRVKSLVASRATNAATRWPLRHAFHELRNNFALVEVLRSGARQYETAFHVYAWNGASAELAYTVRCPAVDAPDER